MSPQNIGTPRERARAQVEDDIVRIGREHLARHGAAALSLRAITRDLGMVSSAVYRYVRSRDELLTLLVVDAYDESADRVAAALDGMEASDGSAAVVGRRLRAAGHALRSWGLEQSSRFALIYGSPVPGYQAPAERTTGPGTRLVALLLTELAHLTPTIESVGAVPASLSREFDSIAAEFGLDLDDPAMVVGTCLWAVMLGAITLEVFGQYGADTFADPATLFDLQLTTVLERLLP